MALIGTHVCQPDSDQASYKYQKNPDQWSMTQCFPSPLTISQIKTHSGALSSPMYVSKAQRVSHRSSTEWACPKALAPESPSRSLEAELNDEVPSGWWTGCFAKYARRWDLFHSSGEHSMEENHCYHHHHHVHRHYFEAFYLHTSSLGFGLTKASSLQLQELHELAYEASRTRACCYNRCTCRKEGRL